MPQLEEVRRELEQTLAHAHSVAAAAGKRFNVRPAAGRWSVAENLQHLNLTTRAYLPKLDVALQQVVQSNVLAQEPYDLEWVARGLKWMLEPPVRLRLPTTPSMEPAPKFDVASVLTNFDALQQRLFEFIAAGRGYALNRTHIVSPFSDRVKYNSYAALVLIAVHQRRHLWQAEQVLKALR